MLKYINRCSHGRGAWILLAFSAFALEMIALYFQYVERLQPCVMCIYERCALFGVVAAGIVGAIAPKSPLRWAAIAIWLYSGWQGLRLAWEHTQYQLHPSPFHTCDFAARFPGWLPLDKWIPSVFVAGGNCSDRTWAWLSLSMPQWLVAVFAVLLLLALLVLLAQGFKTKRRDLFSR